jgi:hypothetical protein
LPLGYNQSFKKKTSAIDSMQVISLDEQGTLIFWSVTNLSQEYDVQMATHTCRTISETDFGLRVGSKVKLIHSGRKNVFGISGFTINNNLNDDDPQLIEQSQQNAFLLQSSRALTMESEPTNSTQ